MASAVGAVMTDDTPRSLEKLLRKGTWQHRRYAVASVSWRFFFYVFETVVVLSGIVVAVMTAAWSEHKTAILVIAGAGSASAALLARLRIRELARAREIGRTGLKDALREAREVLERNPSFLRRGF